MAYGPCQSSMLSGFVAFAPVSASALSTSPHTPHFVEIPSQFYVPGVHGLPVASINRGRIRGAPSRVARVLACFVPLPPPPPPVLCSCKRYRSASPAGAMMGRICVLWGAPATAPTCRRGALLTACRLVARPAPAAGGAAAAATATSAATCPERARRCRRRTVSASAAALAQPLVAALHSQPCREPS